MPDAPASAAERLERLPLSPYHRLIFVIIALAFFFDSMDLAMMTFLLGSIKAEFGLDSAQAGLLAPASERRARGIESFSFIIIFFHVMFVNTNR